LVATVLENNLVGCSVIEDVILPNPAITILEKLTRAYRDMYIRVFMGSLFVIALTWKQPSCPSTGEWTQQGLIFPII